MNIEAFIEAQKRALLANLTQFVESLPDCSGNIGHIVSGADHFFRIGDYVIGVVCYTTRRVVYVQRKSGFISETVLKMDVAPAQAKALIKALTNKVVL